MAGLTQRMNATWFRAIVAVGILLLVVVASMAAADEKAPTGSVNEVIEVKRAQTKDLDHPSLQFLRDNRSFLRSQLDQLRQTRQTTSADAQTLDARLLRLKEMSIEIAAARDTVRDQATALAQVELLDNVTDLGGLVAELSTMESLLGQHRQRLLALETDFLGRQETAMVILLRGMTGHYAPEAVLVGEDDMTVRVELTPEQRASLEQGGIAQLYHEFVEPRAHVLSVSFTGGTWRDAPPVSVTIDAERDRLTFLELDASQMQQGQLASGLKTSVWYR